MKVCKSKSSSRDTNFQGGERRKRAVTRGGQRSYYVGREEKSASDEEGIFTVHSFKEPEIPKVAPLTITLAVNESNIPFEVDTGCGVTVMNGSNFSKLWTKHKIPELKTCSLKLKTYTGQTLAVLGSAQVEVRHKGVLKKLPVVVVPGTGPNLLGRGWIKEFGMEWEAIHKIQGMENITLTEVLSQHSELFKEELGELRGPPAKIYVDKEVVPRFFKARPVPYAMKTKVEAEIERLLKEKIIEPVKHSEWAAPVVPVLKSDNTVRLCGDYKLTVNRVSKLEQYPIPRIDDLFATLSGGQKFTNLDMSHAYHQIALDAESKKYVTVNTHKGLFTYRVLPFGVSSSPAIFQRTMEGVLQGITYVAVFLDDILVTGRNDEEHLQTLARVLRRLQEAGLRLKRSKCSFMEKEVTFLGHKVDETGLHPVPEKVTALQNAPAPKNVTELKAYLGLLNYYNKFLPNLSTILAPVHKLLRKDEKWNWEGEQEAAFAQSKEMINSVQVLLHYDPQKDVILSCDASPYGLGAVLSHKMPDGGERPIGFMSRTLNQAERNYSQLDKEGLAIMFGLQRFHKIQRWAVTLRAYEYNIIYKPGKDHGNAEMQVIIPSVGRSEVLKQLHQCHPGVCRMKAMARSYVWWPKLDQDVERLVKTCHLCQEHRNVPAVAPLHPWNWPEKPWQRLHVDYAGPFMGKMFLVLIDAHSKWMDVYPVNSATSAATIECLRKSFSNQGLPELIVSDHATCFVSAEVKEFLNKNGVQHVTSAPYHASSNGLVERAVQIIKGMLKKCVEGSIATKLARVLFSYRITPQTTTGLSPAEMLQGRKLRCSLDFLHPDLTRKIKNQQQKQKAYHDKKAHERSFCVGYPVLVRNFSYGPKWIPGNIETVTGPVSYKVMLGDGRVVRRHVDQIHGRQELLVKHSREEMDGKSPDYDFFDNSATVSSKETETTGAEDIQGEVDPFEVSEDSSQAAGIITEMDKSVCLVKNMMMMMMKGESVTLNSDLTEIKDDDVIQWRFKDYYDETETLIAEINVMAGRITVYDDVLDGRFRDRLKLNKHTGSLTVINITTEETGLYSLQINGVRKRTIYIGIDYYFGSVTLRSAMKGESVTLNSDLTEIKDDDVIQWRFEDYNDETETLIAEINVTADRIAVYDDVLDGRFRDRLKLNNHTGSLTIINITTEHAGDYRQYAGETESMRFPVIRVLLAVFVEISVMEGESLTINSDLTEIKDYVWIRWIFGDENILIAEINVMYDRIAVYDDYLGRFRDRLKLNNQTGSLTITNITTEQAGDYKLQIIDSVHCCGPTEAAIRLVLSALVGVATVILVVYEIRSRRAERDQAHIHTSET
ncbi:K02A2.6-like [Pimephales promelas]|nr:K02A2.6-like [Pimephales promelas]